MNKFEIICVENCRPLHARIGDVSADIKRGDKFWVDESNYGYVVDPNRPLEFLRLIDGNNIIGVYSKRYFMKLSEYRCLSIDSLLDNG